jgi:hypothetical protein
MKAKYDEFTNMYSLEKDGRAYSYTSLSPRQFYEDQLKLKNKGVSKACLSGIIIRYCFHTMLLEVKVGKKELRRLK